MVHSPLHGLNIVQPDTASEQYSDAQDPLLANAPFPDLAAQLDIWSSLTFQTDDPPPHSVLDNKSRKLSGEEKPFPQGEDDRDDDAETEGPASLEGHVNAVNPTAISNPPSVVSQHQQQQSHYDVGSFLAGFGIDPFLVPQVAPVQSPSQAATLAQLLAAYPFANAPFFPHAPAPAAVPPTVLSTGQQQEQQQSAPESPSETPAFASTKRGRTTRKPPSSYREGSEESTNSSPNTPDNNEDNSTSALSLSPTEDKRRRNTAASARFRLKKKEREAALEKRAAELESRVSTLERECEGLRRENGWLKGLVVGVTGASQSAQVVQQQQHSQGQGSNTGKRKRMGEEGKEGTGTKKLAVVA